MIHKDPTWTWWYVLAVGVAVLTLAVAAMILVYERTVESTTTAEPATTTAAVLEEPKTAAPFSLIVQPNPADGLEYAWIPPGRFLMGCVEGDGECAPDEKPRHLVELGDGFWLTRTEVTVAAYERFTEETDRGMPEAPPFNRDWALGDHPVVNITWQDAMAYCKWAGGRLPSESQWEYAARGGRSDQRFPWGDDVDRAPANLRATHGDDTWAATSPVASFPANGFGLHDMAGNVWEWVADEWHDDYRDAPADDAAWGAPITTAPGMNAAVLRGGSCFQNRRQARCSYRSRFFWPGDRFDDYGFRCLTTALPAPQENSSKPASKTSTDAPK